jgi:hypothetical protein
MFNLGKKLGNKLGNKKEEAMCAAFLEELEEVPGVGTRGVASEEWVGEVSASGMEHARGCAGCGEALRDFAETRGVLVRGMSAVAAEPGPWFSTRVMAAIAAKENELQESAEGFWINVRRMAPRVVAASMLLAALGGTWAIEMRHSGSAKQAGVRSTDSIFEPVQSTPLNDDILVGASESAR